MATVNRPPADITPKSFFETWLPQEYERLKAEGGSTPPNVTACVRLSGDGGGTWTLALAGGQLTVAAEDTADADLGIEQSVADWRAVTVGEDSAGSGPDLTLPEGVSFDRWLVNPGLQQVLATARGALRIEIPGFHGRTFALAVTFRGAAEPQATITVDAETIAAIRAGTLPPMQAFFSGKILIAGDSALAMQIGMAAMSQQS